MKQYFPLIVMGAYGLLLNAIGWAIILRQRRRRNARP